MSADKAVGVKTKEAPAQIDAARSIRSLPGQGVRQPSVIRRGDDITKLRQRRQCRELLTKLRYMMDTLATSSGSIRSRRRVHGRVRQAETSWLDRLFVVLAVKEVADNARALRVSACHYDMQSPWKGSIENLLSHALVSS